MAEFDSEELTQLKQWWSKNGVSILAGLVIGLLVVGGWQAWSWYSNKQAIAAADIYQQVQQGFATGDVNDALVQSVARLKNDYAGTPYAADAALRLARYYVGQKQYDKAREQLDWAMKNASQEGIANVARVRAARLAWTGNDAEGALELLDHDHPDSFNSLYAELAGDIHAAQGDREAAYKSYQLALESLPRNAPRRSLKDKLADSAPAQNGAAPNVSQSGSPS